MNPFDTLPSLLSLQAERRPEATALKALDGPDTSYEALDRSTISVSATLRESGIGEGDRVGIVLPNGPDMARAFLSVTRVATAAPLDPQFTEAEFAFYLNDLEARAVILADPDSTECSRAARDLGIPVVRSPSYATARSQGFRETSPRTTEETPDTSVHARSVALVLHTSGTTARPKIVPLTHENLCSSARNVAASLQLGPEDLCLNVMPLFHIHGLVAALLASLHAGGSVVCSPGFSAPDFFPWMARWSPTWYTAVPTMHQSILRRAERTEGDAAKRRGLRMIRSSSASLPPALLAKMESTFGVPVIEAYGMTEAAHQMTSNPLPPKKRKPGSVGPAAGPEVAVADALGRFLPFNKVGEVVIRGPNVTQAYHGLEDQSGYFFGDGWFRTGDQGYMDEDGYLFLTGRLKEIINRGGETLAPREIDEALLEHPGVRQAVAFSVPDEQLGEEVAAAVVPEEGTQLEEAELQNFLLPRLSWARIPKRVLILGEIPKGPTGKLQRIGLAEKLGLTSVRKNPGEAKSAEAVGRAETVERVAALWREVLQLEEVDPDSPFLEVGGDSVTATSLVLRVEEEFSVELPLLSFFDAATVRRQAELLDGLLAQDRPPTET
jgi:acyl-CoA synthetase (AMP-forming)/AMP-acid ligase II/acyl carrier protein